MISPITLKLGHTVEINVAKTARPNILSILLPVSPSSRKIEIQLLLECSIEMFHVIIRMDCWVTLSKEMRVESIASKVGKIFTRQFYFLGSNLFRLGGNHSMEVSGSGCILLIIIIIVFVGPGIVQPQRREVCGNSSGGGSDLLPHAGISI